MAASRASVAHVALWTTDIERCKSFYVRYFGAQAGAHYRNVAKGFESCFLSFGQGARIEIMTTTSVVPTGLAHIALCVGSEEGVDRTTARLRDDGYKIVDGPRRTGDGYYESVVLDPDGNRVEITAE